MLNFYVREFERKKEGEKKTKERKREREEGRRKRIYLNKLDIINFCLCVRKRGREKERVRKIRRRMKDLRLRQKKGKQKTEYEGRFADIHFKSIHPRGLEFNVPNHRRRERNRGSMKFRSTINETFLLTVTKVTRIVNMTRRKSESEKERVKV